MASTGISVAFPFLRRLALLGMALALAGCATRPITTTAALTWEAHRARVGAMVDWTAQGKLALRTAEYSESANFQWRQRGEATRLELSGPLGVNATTVSSDGRQLEILQNGERDTRDLADPASPAGESGWDLPVAALPHWLRGIPAPRPTVQELVLDGQRLATLRQGGWEVRYERYGEFGPHILPTRLEVRRGSTSARLIIRDWQTGAPP